MHSGPEALHQWMTRRGVNQREAADILGIDFTMLNHYLCERRRPSLGTAVLIEERTGIPARAWVPISDDSAREAAPVSAKRHK